MKICVYCSSSEHVDNHYFETTVELGETLAKHGHTLVYGGANVGLMRKLAETVHQNNGSIIGVMPKLLSEKGLAYPFCNQFINTTDMRSRKEIMDLNSDAFIALPGGFGTLEEVLEILTLKQLGVTNKAVVFINTNNYYDNLIKHFEHSINERFMKSVFNKFYFVANNAAEAINYIENYQVADYQSKW